MLKLLHEVIAYCKWLQWGIFATGASILVLKAAVIHHIVQFISNREQKQKHAGQWGHLEHICHLFQYRYT